MSTEDRKNEQAAPAAKGGKRVKKLSPKQILCIVLAAIAVLVVAGAVFWHFFSAPPDVGALPSRRPQSTTKVDEQGNEIEVEMPGLSGDRKDQFYTFLLVGQDTFGGGNTDTMMLAAYDVPNQMLSVMSLPRDTFVNYRGRRVLLNSVFNRAGGGEDGMAALKAEIGELTGVTPDFHVLVQWEAVGKLVDAIDGVYFEVPFDMYYNDLSQDFKIDLKEGYQLLDGDQAMGLLRWRKSSDDSGHSFGGYPNGDLGRIETQQAFLKAVIAKCLQPTVLLPNLAEYISIFQQNVVTDLSPSNMAYFAKSAIGKLDMDAVEFYTMPYKSAGDGAHVLPVASELLDLVNERFNPYEDDIRLSELDVIQAIATPTPKPTRTPEPAVTETPVATDLPTEEPSQEPAVTPTPGVSEPPAVPSPTPAPEVEPTPAPTAAPPVEPDPVPTTPGGETGPGMPPIDA